MQETVVSQNNQLSGQVQFNGKSRKEIPKQKINNNRHVSVLYGMQYLTRVPIVKRNRKTEIDCFGNINKQEIFSLVHTFVTKILQDEKFLQKVIQETKFDQNQLQTKILSTNKSLNSKNIIPKNDGRNQVSLNQLESSDDFNKIGKPFQNKTNFTHKIVKNTDSKRPKISIMLEGDDFDFSQQNINSQQFSSSLFSDQTLPPGVSSIDISQQQLTMKMIELIYEQPQPFLINLSVCLMLKYLQSSKTKLNKRNVCWILSVGTIIAYKIYYDEPVEGLVESFAYILKLTKDDIITLERHFLNQIDHEAVISSQQYHSTLYQIIKSGTQ